MIGQNEIQNTLLNKSLADFPHSLLFIGETGCGKHTLVNEIVHKYNFELVEVPADITGEEIANFSLKAIKTIYLINLKNFDERIQNKFLKFIEEPLDNIYIILLSESEAGILPTILNRCFKYTFIPYSKEELLSIVPSLDSNLLDLYLAAGHTPGQLEGLNSEMVSKLSQLCSALIRGDIRYSYAQLLGLSTQFNYADEFSKFDIINFFNLLEYFAKNAYYQENNKQAYIIYMLTIKYKQLFQTYNVNKEVFMLSYLTRLWQDIFT